MAGPDETLERIIATLRESETLLSEHLRESEDEPALGMLAAVGPRAAGAEADYAFVVEAVREGYLLHYGTPRIVAGADRDLALLAGDHLYAVGLECLAGLGDLEAVRELADLISLSAQLHADGPSGGNRDAAAALWLAVTTAITVGTDPAYAAARDALRSGDDPAAAAAALAEGARESARKEGIESALESAADSIDFELPHPPASG